MNLLDPFQSHSLQHPNDLALWVDREEFSYRQLHDQVRRIAGWITTNIEKTNPRIGILAGRSLTAYLGILAASYAGAAYVPFNFKAPPQYLSGILEAAHLDGLIVDRIGTGILQSIGSADLPSRILSPLDDPSAVSPTLPISPPEALDDIVPLPRPANVNNDDIAYVMFTSGTTGQPKGITISIANIQHLLTTLQQRYRYEAADRLSQAFELTFDLSVFDIFMALRSGASLHVVPDELMPTPARFIQQQELTSWFSVPSMIGMLKQMKLLRPNAYPTLRLSLFCGEALPAESVETWQAAAPNSRTENLYGPTEVTVACLLQDCSAPHCVTPERGIIAIGQPFPGLHAAIVDHDMNFLPQGEQGELAIHGPQVAPGYLDNPNLSAQRFPTLHHPELGSSRWYLTGDLAYIDEEQRYHFLGRVDNQVQLRGYRVELDEIEYHLRAASGCDNAVAVFIDGPEAWAREIIGVLPDRSIDKSEVRKQLGNRLPPYMVPKRIVTCEEIPRNASGKIDRKTLARQMISSRTRFSQ